MQILSDRKHLAHQIKANVLWYDREANRHHQGTLSQTWIKYVAKLTPHQWNALQRGDSAVPITVYRKTLRLLQDMEESVLGTSYRPGTQAQISKSSGEPKKSGSSMTTAKRNMQKMLARIHQQQVKQSKPKAKSNSAMNQAKQNLRRVLGSLDQSRPRAKRVVTLIKAQKRQRNRFNVYVNGRYAFPAGINELTRYHLRIGMPISHSLQRIISESSDVSKMFNRASVRIVHHLRTEYEIRKWLHQKYDCSADDANRVLKMLKDYHLIDDAHYSHEYIRAEIVSGSKGPEAIVRHLRSKGIEALMAQDAIAKFYPIDKQLVIARRRAKDKFRMQSHTPFTKRLRKIKRSLVRKGFSFDVADQAIDECHFQPNHEQQKRLLTKYTRQAFHRYGRKLNRNNHYQINVKIKRFLFRKGFGFDAINQAMAAYQQSH